jgi:hypothetical protein
MDGFTSINVQKPDKDKALIIIDTNGNQYNGYRCGCGEGVWKDSITANRLDITVSQWKYV